MTKLIINAETGETVERELSADEIAQQEIDSVNFAAKLEAEKAEAEAKAKAKATAEGKLSALGLTTDDLRALGL